MRAPTGVHNPPAESVADGGGESLGVWPRLTIDREGDKAVGRVLGISPVVDDKHAIWNDWADRIDDECSSELLALMRILRNGWKGWRVLTHDGSIQVSTRLPGGEANSACLAGPKPYAVNRRCGPCLKAIDRDGRIREGIGERRLDNSSGFHSNEWTRDSRPVAFFRECSNLGGRTAVLFRIPARHSDLEMHAENIPAHFTGGITVVVGLGDGEVWRAHTSGNSQKPGSQEE